MNSKNIAKSLNAKRRKEMMNKITISKLAIKEFCGIYSYTNNSMDSNVQNFSAVNGNGKSSIKKAIFWVLGLNVGEIAPTKNKIEIQNLTPCVEMEMLVNGMAYTVKKEWKTTWVMHEATNKMVKKSAKSVYYIDTIEMTEKNFKSKIADIFGLKSYDDLEMLLDIEFFNRDNTKWKWNNRRSLLLAMSGAKDIDKQILNSKNEYAPIKDMILKGTPTSDITSALKKEKKGYNEQVDKNNILIEQKNKELAELLEINFDEITADLSNKEAELDKLVEKGKKQAITDELKALQDDLFKAQQELSKEQVKQAKVLQGLNTQKANVYTKLNNIKMLVEKHKSDIELNEKKLSLLDKPINDTCPTCGQKLPADEIEKAKQNVERDKITHEHQINFLREEIEAQKPIYADTKAEYDKICAEINNFADSERIVELQNAIQGLEIAIKQAKQKDLINLSTDRINALKIEIRELQVKLSKKDDMAKIQNTIKVWKSENIDLADKILNVDLKLKLINKFVQEQCDLIEQEVNSLFGNGITFALFDIIDNNGEPKISEACETIYNGRNYKACSTGEKAICDLRIAERLQDYFNVNLPIVVDNTESITSRIDSDRQLIRLRAMENAKIDGLVKIEEMY